MDIHDILFGGEDASFLWEVVIRTTVMFLAVVTAIRILGKRGVKQLSVFELVIIISMGSAAGDPMFYKDVGILPAFVVFTIIALIYKLIMYLLNKSERFEHLLEGRPVYLIREGKFCFKAFENEPIALDEFFAELRQQNVSQLGQIKAAIIETNGNMSVFFYEDKDVLYGLPILPDAYDECMKRLEREHYYSCKRCGNTEYLKPLEHYTCNLCKHDEWVYAINERRIT